jgi:hypothetical protein
VADPTAVSASLAQILRPPFTDLLMSLGLPDLRKHWDSPEILAFGCLLNKETTRDLINSVCESFNGLTSGEADLLFADRLRTYRSAREWRASSPAARLLDALEDVKQQQCSDLNLRTASFREFISQNATLCTGASELLEHNAASFPRLWEFFTSTFCPVEIWNADFQMSFASASFAMPRAGRFGTS